ncbi:hypothetical protein [Pseudonocardia sp.]|uniref:hypothetical protein n=1 Tax=Pseudonocardia sp. TaxID=60912 RepID=UPI0031FD2138
MVRKSRHRAPGGADKQFAEQRSLIPGSGDLLGWHGGERPATEGWVAGGVHASFLHTHPAADTTIIACFLAAAAR